MIIIVQAYNIRDQIIEKLVDGESCQKLIIEENLMKVLTSISTETTLAATNSWLVAGLCTILSFIYVQREKNNVSDALLQNTVSNSFPNNSLNEFDVSGQLEMLIVEISGNTTNFT